ncbi:unnamed protein product [Anisakis simplex]|uniref:Zf-C3Hc3H domain-containing protein n=1 Tax=Anisakis simplex TaxID=6269 RepID=A0A0M3JUN3_ANISI|nr:unnamed protein product [Anisakis simplex]
MPSISTYKSSTKRPSSFSSKQPPTSTSHISANSVDGSSQKMKLKRRVRSQKRAWKWHVPRGESSDENCSKCQYVSRRIGIACDNVQPSSQLSSVGICEKHMRFARQLKQLFVAEQHRADQGDFIAPRMDEDGMISVRCLCVYYSDDDETLATTSEWPWSEENLLYDPSSVDDRVNVALNSEAITEKELLLGRLATLENRLAAIKEYREVLFERRSRFEVFLQEKVAEETKKGKLVAETAKEKRLMRLLRASKRYDHWLTSKSSKAMRSQLLARIKQNEERNKKVAEKDESTTEELMESNTSKSEEPLDFFDVFDDSTGNDDSEQKQSTLCSFVYEQEEEESGGGGVVGGENTEETNSKQTENGEHKKVKQRQCTNRAIPYLNYCIGHVFENANQQMFAACLECGAAALDFDDGEHYCFEHLYLSFSSRLDELELVGANSDFIQYEEEGSAPVKFVLIDDEDENETGKNDMATITKNFNSTKGAGSSGGYAMNPNISVRRVPMIARRRVDEKNSSSARTRPFTSQYFIESKEKSKQ